jgi:hypothetical protein
MQLTKKKTAILTLALIFCIGIASATLLEYYAKIETTVTVSQGIKVDGKSYDELIATTVSTVGGGVCYEIHSITNYGDSPATVSLSYITDATEGELAVEYFINSATLVLENKDSDWAVIDDEREAILTYNLVGDTFDFKLLGFSLEPSTDYSLIYYADYDEFGKRFDYWGGDNPGAFIAEGTTDGFGNLLMEGSTDIGMDLPSWPDANINFYDYSEAPDFYTHAHGAKIWLVPSSDYNGVDKLTAWNPEAYLFETDLISYIDLEVPTHYILPDPEAVTTITILPHQTINFVISITPKSETKPGTFVVTTTVAPLTT